MKKLESKYLITVVADNGIQRKTQNNSDYDDCLNDENGQLDPGERYILLKKFIEIS